MSRGGHRKGAGRPLALGVPTVRVDLHIPEATRDALRRMAAARGVGVGVIVHELVVGAGESATTP